MGLTKAASDATKEEKEVGVDVIDAIVKVIPSLDEEVDFTGSGAPSVEALEESLGFDVSASQRDEAWAKYQAENEE